MVGNHLDQRFLILVTNAVFSTRHCPRQRKNPVKVRRCTQHKDILVLPQIRFYTFLQVPLCHGLMFRTRNRRSLRDNHIDLSNASVQNLVHDIAAHAVQPKIASIQQPLAVRFDQEHIAVTRGMVDTEWRDLNITDQKRLAGRKGLNGFDALAKRFVLLPATLCGQAHDVLCQRTGINGNLRSDTQHLPGMIAVIVGKQYSIAMSIPIRHTRNIQRCGNEIWIKR